MTPKEYKERLLTALKTSSYKEYADIARKTMREYVNFAWTSLKSYVMTISRSKRCGFGFTHCGKQLTSSNPKTAGSVILWIIWTNA